LAATALAALAWTLLSATLAPALTALARTLLPATLAPALTALARTLLPATLATALTALAWTLLSAALGATALAAFTALISFWVIRHVESPLPASEFSRGVVEQKGGAGFPFPLRRNISLPLRNYLHVQRVTASRSRRSRHLRSGCTGLNEVDAGLVIHRPCQNDSSRIIAQKSERADTKSGSRERNR
jgi:hypothetical protein